MSRNPHQDPRPGDRFHHPQFAGGATMTIATRGIRAGGQGRPYVAPTYQADDGHRIEPRGRSMGLPIPADWTYLPPPQIRCGCGHTFPAACGKYGCPNCESEQGARARELP